jgi:prophage DNA circulation protein
MDLNSATNAINALTAASFGASSMPALNALPFFRDLRTASWRGVPFGVSNVRHSFGRKNAVHQYPYVDGVWVEDLGQQAKRYHVRGFFVEGGGAYGGGGTLKSQVERMDRAVAQADDAVLVHPLLGSLSKISLIDYECDLSFDKGRVAELTFTLIDNSARKQPSIILNTPAATQLAAAASFLAQLQDFEGAIHNLVSTPLALVQSAVNRLTTLARSVTFTSTSLVTMVAASPGAVGRMVGQTFPASQKNSRTTVASLIGAASAAQAHVLNVSAALTTVASSGNVAGIGAGIQSVIGAAAQANPDPRQAMQSMQAVVQGSPSTAVQATPVLTATVAAVTDLVRRAAVTVMAQSSATYQPVSCHDAELVRRSVCAAIDAEMTLAGDQGLDATYNALRELKVAVARDITQRGASLANVMAVSSQLPVSSLVWAQLLYQDVGREDEIVREGNPVHPCFMPTRFSVLAP